MQMVKQSILPNTMSKIPNEVSNKHRGPQLTSAGKLHPTKAKKSTNFKGFDPK